MSLSHSPKIVTDGLVLYYDMANTKKSWKGAPTTNLYSDGDFSSGTLHPVRAGTWQFVPDPRNPLKQVIKASPSASNQYHGRDIPVTISSVYSLQMEIYVSSDFNGTNVQMYPEQGGAGANRIYDLTKKGTWQLLKFDGKSATTTNIRMLAYVLSSFTTGYVLVSNVQVELAPLATPFINGTRSNTQALLDLSNNNTITANNLTYNSDGSFSFNGTDNDLSISGTASTFFTDFTTQQITLETWIKIPAAATWSNGFYSNILSRGSYAGSVGLWRHTTNNQIVAYFRQSGATFGAVDCLATITRDAWYHLTATWTGTVLTLYVNGVQASTNSGTLGTPTVSNWTIGNVTAASGANGNRFQGDVTATKIYNRALSASEVIQNFNAQRGRFGL